MILSFLTPDALVGYVFLLVVCLTVIGGLVACTAERLVRALAGLIVCFLGVAALYYFLNSPFVSMMQILIYVGAVAVTIAFAIMLAAPEEKKLHGPNNALTGPFGFVTATLVTIGFSTLALRTEWQAFAKINTGDVKIIGTQLLTNHSLVFELVSIVLLISIIGALVIAREGRKS